MSVDKIRSERLEIHEDKESAVYRIYSADDELLYVGHTTRPIWVRLTGHQNKKWFNKEAAYVLVDYYEDVALQVEQELIRKLSPKYNRDYRLGIFHETRVCAECGGKNRSRTWGLCPSCRDYHYLKGKRKGERCQCHYCECGQVGCPICYCQCDDCLQWRAS